MDDNDNDKGKDVTGPKDGDQVFVTFRGTYKGFDEYQGTHRIMGHWDGSEHVPATALELQWSATVTADEAAWFRNEDPEGLEREREAVSAAHDPADITEEPPVGSQVTDREGDIWERREGGWALWWLERGGWIADRYTSDPSPWQAVRNQAPLRSTTDADRERVGLPVEPAPADVDPDEGLGSVVDVTDLYAQLDKAQADLARVTKERDSLRHVLGGERKIARAVESARDERTRDAIEWRNRYDALRHEVWVESGSRVAAVAAAAHGVLARADRRAES